MCRSRFGHVSSMNRRRTFPPPHRNIWSCTTWHKNTEIAFSLCVWTANVELYLYIYGWRNIILSTQKISLQNSDFDTWYIFFKSSGLTTLADWFRLFNLEKNMKFQGHTAIPSTLSLKGWLSNAKFKQDMACHWSCSVPLDDGLNEARILKSIDISDIQNSPPWWFLNCRFSSCFFCPWKSGRGRAVGLRFGFTDYEFRQWSQAPLLQG